MDTAETLPPTSYKFTFSPSKAVQPCPLSITSQQSDLNFLQICNSGSVSSAMAMGGGGVGGSHYSFRLKKISPCVTDPCTPKRELRVWVSRLGTCLERPSQPPNRVGPLGLGSRLPLDPLPMTRGSLRSSDPFPKICSLAQMLRLSQDPSRRGWEGKKEIKAQSYLSPLSLLQVSRIANEFHTRVS